MPARIEDQMKRIVIELPDDKVSDYGRLVTLVERVAEADRVGGGCVEFGDGDVTWRVEDISGVEMSVREALDKIIPNSVLQPWVMQLPRREQGVLLTAVRGCDLTPKYPLDSVERRLVGAVRHAFMVPADSREVDLAPGCFFISQIPDPERFKPSAMGHYPQHWVSHILHAIEVLGYRHPVTSRREMWFALYVKLCHSLHLNPETKIEMVTRLSEDRIKKGTVVS
jgi:hypothetical protein